MQDSIEEDKLLNPSEASSCLPGPIVAIVGPTAVGKSALAQRVATKLDSVVIGADAMQVYRGMDVGTAKDIAAVRAHELLMVDIAEITTDYSVALYQRAARACVNSCLLAGKAAIVCGGTGLYVDAIIDDVSYPKGRKMSPERKAWEEFAQAQGADALYEELMRRDSASAALIHPHNVRRVVRALELFDAGVSYAEQNAQLHIRKPYYNARVFALTMNRAHLYDRIDRRVNTMLATGLVDEVAALAAKGLDVTKTAGQAIGYKEILEYLSGKCALDDAIELIKLRSRRYAKRQLSWIRRRDDVTWLDLDALAMDEACEMIVECVGSIKIISPSQQGTG